MMMTLPELTLKPVPTLQNVEVRAVETTDWMAEELSDALPLRAGDRARVEKLFDPKERAKLRANLAAERMLLARLSGGQADTLALSRNVYGAPMIEGCSVCNVSISRSASFVAVAYSDSRPVGVDIEHCQIVEWLPMLAMVCDTDEADIFKLFAESMDEPLIGFRRMWTIKEAVLKAIGQGLAGDAKRVRVPASLLIADGTGAVNVGGKDWDVAVHKAPKTIIAIAAG